MDKLFLSVLNMSLTGAIVIAAICLARLLLKKAPKIISYCLWAVAGFRLVFPFSIESLFSLMPIKPQPIPANIAMQSIPRIDSGIPFLNNAVSSVLPAATPAASVNPLQIWTAVGACVWLFGVAAMLIYGVASFVAIKRKMRGAPCIEANIHEAENIKSPFVLGIFSPRIYLPVGLSEHERGYILLHEQTHIRRRDHIVKFAAYLVLCLHWFNPLAWVAFLLVGADMEMSADEQVLKELGKDIRDDYSMSLVRIATGRRILNGSPLAFGEGGMKERIKRVLNFNNPSRVVIVAAVALAVALSAGFAVNRASEKISGDENEPYVLNELETYSRETYSRQSRDYAAQLIQDTYTSEGSVFSDSTEIAVTLGNGDILKKTYGGWYFQSSYILYADLTGDGSDEIIVALQIGGSNYGATDIHVLSVSNGVLMELLTIMDSPGSVNELETEYKDSLFVIPLVIADTGGIPADELEHCYNICTGAEIAQTSEGVGLWVQHLIKRYDAIPYSVIRWNGTEWFVAEQGVRPLPDTPVSTPPGNPAPSSMADITGIRNQVYLGMTDKEVSELFGEPDYRASGLMWYGYNDIGTFDPCFSSTGVIESISLVDGTHWSVYELINAAVIQHNDGNFYAPAGAYPAESHVVLALDADKNGFTVYIMSLYQNYLPDGEYDVREVSGTHLPLALTFDKTQNGNYILSEYWEPANGTQYMRSIRAKFPQSIGDMADTQHYIEASRNSCYSQAMYHFVGAMPTSSGRFGIGDNGVRTAIVTNYTYGEITEECETLLFFPDATISIEPYDESHMTGPGNLIIQYVDPSKNINIDRNGTGVIPITGDMTGIYNTNSGGYALRFEKYVKAE
jgi:beta-lactamase regulating signal transducer with metallopeptidase domain